MWFGLPKPVVVRRVARILLIVLLAAAFCGVAEAQQAPSKILKQYRDVRTSWFAAVAGQANRLFALLAIIEFAWSGAILLLEKADLQSWTAGVIRRLMFIGAFYALLINGRFWIPVIIDSFEALGQNAAHMSAPLAPSDVFVAGLNIAAALLGAASDSGFLANFGSALALVFAATMTVLAFLAITVQFVVAIVESYIVVAAGIIFLGFGGSRWTAPYVERYLALAVATGVKIMILYLLIAAGMSLTVEWQNSADGLATMPQPSMSAWEIMGAALIFAAICWQAPKLVAGVMGGSPALTGGDVVSTGAAIGYGAALLGTAVVTGVAGLAAGGGGGASGGATSLSQAVKVGGGAGGSAAGAGAAGAGGGAGPSKAASAAMGAGAGKSAASGAGQASRGAQQPAPPTEASGGARPSAPRSENKSTDNTSGLRRLRRERERLRGSDVPSDSAPHTPPPQLNIDAQGE
jgi:type IV secretion system protein TrbL